VVLAVVHQGRPEKAQTAVAFLRFSPLHRARYSMSLWAAGEQRGRAASTEVATLEPTITITASAAAVLRTCERMGARLLIGFSLSEAGEAKAIRLSRNRADPRAAPAVAWKARAASLVAVVPVARKAAALVAVARKAEAALAVPEVRPGVAQGLMGGRGATAYLEVAAVAVRAVTVATQARRTSPKAVAAVVAAAAITAVAEAAAVQTAASLRADSRRALDRVVAVAEALRLYNNRRKALRSRKAKAAMQTA